MKRIVFLLFIISLSTAQAQKFSWSMIPAVTVNDSLKKVICKLALDNTTYLGNINFLVNEKDVRPAPKLLPTSPRSMEAYIYTLKTKLKNNPDSASIYLSLATAYQSIYRFDEASKCYGLAESNIERRLRKNAEDATAWRQKGIVALQLKGDLVGAEINFDKALSFNPYDTTARIFKVLIFSSQNKLDSASAFCKRTMRDMPNSLSAYLLYTNVMAAMVMSDSSKLGKETTLCMDQYFDLAYLDILANQSPSDESAILMSHLLRINLLLFKYRDRLVSEDTIVTVPCDVDEVRAHKAYFISSALVANQIPRYTLYNALGWVYLLEANHDSALIAFDKALLDKKNYDPSFADVFRNIYNNKIATYLLKNDTLGSERCLKQKIEQQESIGFEATDYVLLGKFKIYAAYYSGAIEHCSRALSHDPYLTSAYRTMAVASLFMKKTDEASQYAEAAIKISKTEAETQILLGLIYLYKGMSAFAYSYFQEAWSLDPGNESITEIMDIFYKK